MTTRILLADDHTMVREGISALLNNQPGMTVVGEASNGRDALQMAQSLLPDVVIMDVSMPDMNGVSATEKLSEVCPAARVLALSMHTDRDNVTRMLRAGASGYVVKTCDVNEILRAITTVRAGRTYLSPEITGTVVEDYVSSKNTSKPDLDDLTSREREILQMIAEGKSSKQIGTILHISPRTADSHRQRIMDKLNLYSLAELTKYAIRAGLTSLNT